MAEMAFGSIGPPCPALGKENGLHYCVFIKVEQEIFKEHLLADALGIGTGCEMVRRYKEVISICSTPGT